MDKSLSYAKSSRKRKEKGGMKKLNEKTGFKELIIKSQSGDLDATEQLINRLSPLIKKHSFKLGYDEACSDLTLWILETIAQHKPNVIWESGEIENIIQKRLNDG